MGEPEKDKKCCDSHKMNDLIGSDHVMSTPRIAMWLIPSNATGRAKHGKGVCQSHINLMWLQEGMLFPLQVQRGWTANAPLSLCKCKGECPMT